MITLVLHCPYCHDTDVVRHGTTPEGKQRYRCRECRLGRGRTFLLEYTYAGQLPEVKQQIVDMAMNASGIRDTARVLHISPTTVLKVAYPRPADIVSRPLPFRLRPMDQPVMRPPTGSPPLVCPCCPTSEHPEPLHTTSLNRHAVLGRLCLGPRRHPVEQHLFERPYMVCQSRCHRRCTRPPHLR